MGNVLRLGRVELNVLDLDQSVDYYTNVIGLEETGRAGNSVYLKAWDEYDHHSLILTKSNTAGLVHMAFKVETLDDLAYYEKKVEEFGCTTSRISSHTRLAEGEAVHFILPTGHHCELYYEIGFLGTAVGTRNPHPWPLTVKGIAPHRLDHLLLTGDDLKTVTRFFVEVLDFKQSERIVTEGEEELLGSFLFSTNKAHDIAFVHGPDAKLHHVLSMWILYMMYLKQQTSYRCIKFRLMLRLLVMELREDKRFTSSILLETEMKHLLAAIWHTVICRRLHGMHLKLELVFSITVENCPNPL